MFKKYFLKPSWLAYLFIILISLIPIFWFRKEGYMVNGVDTNFPLDPLVWFKERFFVWNPAQNSGVDASASVTGLFFHGLQALLYLLGFSLINTEKLTFVFWFLMLGFSIYYLISVLQKVYFQSLNNWWAIYLPRLTAVCFYIFNLYQFDVWKNVKVANLMLLVAIPLILGSFMEGLYKKTKIPTMIFKIALFSLLFSGFGLNPSYFLVLILVIALYGIFSLFDKNLAQRTTFSKITFTLLSIVLIFAISAFWIMPLAANILRDHGLSGLSIKDLGLQDWLYGLSKNTSTIAVLRFLGAWDWYEKGLFNIPYVSFAKAYFTNPFLILFSVLIPGVAFGGFFLGRKYFFPFYFIVLVFLGVILGTGVHAPFGFFYLWLSQNVSLVSLFRSPWYIFTPLTVLGFAVLIALFTQEVLVRLKFSLVAKSTIILFILSNFIFNYPFLRGDIFRPNQQLGTFFVKIPNYVYAFDNFLKTVPEDARILNLPLESAENYTWGYSGVTPLVSLFSNKSIIFPTYGQENQGLVSDMGNILEEEIALGNIASVRKIFSFLNIGYVLNKKDLFDASVFNDNLFEDSVFDLNNKKTFGEWSFFPLTNAYTGSLFWTAKDKVMVSGNPAKLVTVSSLTEYQKDSEVYFPDMISSSLESKSFKPNKIFAVADCIRCQGEKPKDPFLPYVRFLPGSLLYNLISFKEQRQEGTFVDPVVKSDFELSLSLKRLAEIKGLLDKADPNAGDQIVDTFDALQEKIRQSITLLDKADEQQGDTNGERIKILDYLAGYQNYLRVFSDKYLPSGVADKIDETSLFIEKEKLAMENKLWVTDNILEKKYIIGIPRSGEYKMLMQEDKNALVSFEQNPYANLRINLENNPSTMSGVLREDGWIDLGKVKLGQGKHKLIVYLPQINNLVSVPQDNVITLSADKFMQSLTIPIDNLKPFIDYRISFEFRTLQGIPPFFALSQDSDQIINNLENFKLKANFVSDQRWQTYDNLFREDPKTKKAELLFYARPDINNKTIIELRNIRVERNYVPKIVFEKINKVTEELTLNTPSITYIKINPTKFIVSVKNATDPFTLIFSESFDKNWQAVLTQQKIKENNHLLVNGYANGWYINTKGDYLITIEYQGQKLFIYGLIFSMTLCLTLLIYLTFIKIKHE